MKDQVEIYCLVQREDGSILNGWWNDEKENFRYPVMFLGI